MNRSVLLNSINHFDAISLLQKNSDTLEAIFGSEFAEMKNYSQNNPHHCYDLLEHTLRTVDALDCSELHNQQILELKIAALYHDVGKPLVASEKNGRTVYYGHASESERIARTVLSNVGFSGKTLERICFYILHHDDFISFKLREEIDATQPQYVKAITMENVRSQILSIKRKLQKSSEFIPSYSDFQLLLILCAADATSQSELVVMNGEVVDGRAQKISRIKAISEVLSELGQTEEELFC